MGLDERKIAMEARTGAVLGALLALPMTIALMTHKGPHGDGLTWNNFAQVLMLVPAPGAFFAFGKWGLALPINALLWAGSWAIWRSPRTHGSTQLAIGITTAFWCVWILAAWLLGTTRGSD